MDRKEKSCDGKITPAASIILFQTRLGAKDFAERKEEGNYFHNAGDRKVRWIFQGPENMQWIIREDKSSPTVMNKALICMVDAHEGRDMIGEDFPNAFIQTKLP